MSKALEIGNPAFWLARAPGLHIGDEAALAAGRAIHPSNEEAEDFNGRLRQEGYFRTRHDFGLDLAGMADIVRALVADGIPPVFAFVYDEFWAPFRALDGLYGGILGRYGSLPDFWIWHVDPSQGDSGWKPHRDKGRFTLRSDGSPLSLSTWIPLTDATPLNSCMYVVPADADTTYGTEREAEWKFELCAIRALPATPGDVLVWNQALLHWGSRGTWRDANPRISISMEMQAAEVVPPFNQPFTPSGTLVPFELRLSLIGKQILQYRHMYRIDPAIEAAAATLAARLVTTA